MSQLSDYLDGVLGHGHGGGHGGWHGGGHGGNWGWGRGGGYGWGGGYPVYQEPIFVETERKLPVQYVGIRPPQTIRCAQRPIGDGLWSCYDGATVIYDVAKWQVTPSGIARR